MRTYYNAEQKKQFKKDKSTWPKCQWCGTPISWENYKIKYKKRYDYVEWAKWQRDAKFCDKYCSNRSRASKVAGYRPKIDRPKVVQPHRVEVDDRLGKPIIQGMYVFDMHHCEQQAKRNPLRSLEFTLPDQRDEIVDRVCQELQK